MCATSAAAAVRRKYGKYLANFFVYYLVDDETSKHNLTLDGYGRRRRPVGAARGDCLRGALWLWYGFS